VRKPVLKVDTVLS